MKRIVRSMVNLKRFPRLAEYNSLILLLHYPQLIDLGFTIALGQVDETGTVGGRNSKISNDSMLEYKFTVENLIMGL